MTPKLITILAVLIQFASSAKILGFFAVPSISHQQVFRELMLALSKRGHDVTIVTPDPIGITATNYTEIDLHFVYQPFRKQFEGYDRKIPELVMLDAFDGIFNMIDIELSHEPVREIFRTGKFDVVLVELLMLPSLCAIAHHFKAPFIGVTSLDLSTPTHAVIGNPFNPAYYPEMILPYSDKKNFYERFRSTLSYLFWMAAYKYHWVPMHDALAKKHFGPDTPYVGDLEKNVSLVLAYTDVSSYFPLPTVPAYVRFGGGRPIHMGEPKPLPQDIKTFLDNANDGVIYFSLGSNVKSNAMPEAKRQIFIEAFKQIKQKVLWKWEADVLPGQPENVKIGKWLPQTDILAHPNVKVFITQGGLQSVSEATYNKIPMVVIPFFADQELNAKKLVSEGVAVRVDYEDLKLKDFLDALKNVIQDKGYKERITKYSELTQDQPQNPLDRAVWWTEYVIRHKGARHLRSAAVDMPWYQYFLLDVYAFILAVLAIVLYIFYITIRAIFRLLFKSNKNKTKKD